MLNWKQFIPSDPSTLYEKMVIKGNKIPMELILEKLAGDYYSFEAILKADPGITIGEMKACLLFAANMTTLRKTLALTRK
jgi:uncharacterized protein (DUF433 family)